MRLDTKQALRPVLSLPNPSRMQAARWGRSQAGHKTGPAACFEPAESERHAGREVGRSQCGLETSPAVCLKPHESKRLRE